MNAQPDSIRLDKWLWNARFFKTRRLASEAISGGKVHLNHKRTKPGKLVNIGSFITIHKVSLEWNIEVTGISAKRVSAPLARELYTESTESEQKRAADSAQIHADRAAMPTPVRKPNKRDRRLIHKFKQDQ
jgi:ribosome-associated heat shock protein Hsp15